MAGASRHHHGRAWVPIGQRVHRILRGMGSFRVGRDADEDLGLPTPLADGELFLGIYRNVSGTLVDAIVVGDMGLHVRRPRAWEFTSYSEIAAIDTDGAAKNRVSALMLTLTDGTVRRLPVAGGTDGGRDVWEWMRFLLRVVEDLQRGSSGPGRG